jgi:hypothetical protein
MTQIIKGLDPIYTPEEVKNINKRLKKYDLPERNEPESAPAKDAIKSARVFTVPCIDVMDIMNSFITSIRKCNGECFGFDLYEYYDLDHFNYNEYQPGEEYEWHADGTAEAELPDMKLTCILNLSEESYTGGDLSFNANDKIINNPVPGGVVIFPSFLLHKVTPVVGGKRITLSYWATGPKWK